MVPHRVVCISEQVVSKPVGDEIVLLDFQNGMYYGLDAVGVRVWELIAAGQSMGAIVDALAEEYDVARETLERDIDALLAELERRGLIR